MNAFDHLLALAAFADSAISPLRDHAACVSAGKLQKHVNESEFLPQLEGELEALFDQCRRIALNSTGISELSAALPAFETLASLHQKQIDAWMDQYVPSTVSSNADSVPLAGAVEQMRVESTSEHVGNVAAVQCLTPRIRDLGDATLSSSDTLMSPCEDALEEQNDADSDSDLLKTPTLEDFGLSSYASGAEADPSGPRVLDMEVGVEPDHRRNLHDTEHMRKHTPHENTTSDAQESALGASSSDESAQSLVSCTDVADDEYSSGMRFVSEAEFSSLVPSFIRSQFTVAQVNRHIGTINRFVGEGGGSVDDRTESIVVSQSELESAGLGSKTKAMILLLVKVDRLVSVRRHAHNAYRIVTDAN